ncbi:hypothetical protein A2U01_0079153, partial [Trifolium medium]|nr:hypothetical protein [Trifolium medium]
MLGWVDVGWGSFGGIHSCINESTND